MILGMVLGRFWDDFGMIFWMNFGGDLGMDFGNDFLGIWGDFGMILG